MPRRRSERGEGNLGCIFWLLAMGIVLLIAWKAIPVKLQSAELYDHMDEIAKFAARRATIEEIEKSILARAVELKIPLQKKDITVNKTGQRIFMQIEYNIPLEFPGFTYQWHFKQTVDRPIFVV